MQSHCGVFRKLDMLKEGQKMIADLVSEVNDVHFADKSRTFNTARFEAFELTNMIEVARATTTSAANRLGTNSLLDLIVFGRAAGNHIIGQHPEKQHSHEVLPETDIEASRDRIDRIESRTSGSKAQDVAHKMQTIMQAHCGVFRKLDTLKEGEKFIDDLVSEVNDIYYADKSTTFNTARFEAFELTNMIEVARATTRSAANRLESRGAHALDEYPDRDDVNWLKHTLWFSENSRLEYKPVHMKPLTVDTIPPKARTF
jgi:succinate dehydrogenase / fumarate reductase flavoprotein subunit